MVWKPFRKDKLLKDPLSDSWTYFLYMWKVCQVHLGSSILYLYTTLLTWPHRTEITTASPPASSSSTCKMLPFYSLQPPILTAKPGLPALLLLSVVVLVFQLSSFNMAI